MNEQLDPQNPTQESTAITPMELAIVNQFMSEERAIATEESGSHKGWPGDGSGEDDFADMNQNEAMDYSNE